MQRDANNGKSVYVAELDVHFPELTLGQTLAFDASIMSNGLVHKYCGMVASLRGSSRYISQVCSLFHLEQAFNPQVGDATIRCISGDEKRLISLAEAFVGGAQFQC